MNMNREIYIFFVCQCQNLRRVGYNTYTKENKRQASEQKRRVSHLCRFRENFLISSVATATDRYFKSGISTKHRV